MTTGFLWGKFMPLHRGHMHLIESARARVDRLTVLLCSVRSQPIPGEVRYRWLCQLYPDLDIQHCAEELPQYPSEHPDYWSLWLPIIRCHCPVIDFVFTSETYGDEFARLLGAKHLCVDLNRDRFPVSGTAVRADPARHSEFLPPLVRTYFSNSNSPLNL
ncbi:MAG: adenylyltransferase/cytidyltransferase family protein [Chloroflexi bacterium]|nr:adenylyltransferase/cytidyltransferase family protein [Chloroflexota bacterium]